MTDKATPSLRQRCDTALQSLPDAAYKTMLAALFDDLLGLAAQAAPTDAYERTTQPSLATDYEAHQKNGLAWAVNSWMLEVKNRPLINVHRRTLDDTWRQVIRYFGGNPDSLIGPSHDALMDAEPKRNGRPISWGEEAAQPPQAPVVQAVQPEYCTACDSNQKCPDCPRCASSGATTADVRMLTDAEQTAIIDMHNTGRAQGDHECVEDIQRKFCAVNAGKRIPADGVIGSAA